jgi:hypothetical protein
VIDPKGLRGFRPEHRVSNDPDETEGRMLYRALANAEARRAFALQRRARLKPAKACDKVEPGK